MMFDIGEVHRQRYTRVKRVVDVALGLVGTLVLARSRHGRRRQPVRQPGPLLYRQTRVGKNGELFSILKFRTMRPGRTAWPTSGPARTTPGSPASAASCAAPIDELPRWSTSSGAVSVVGPRPEQPHYVEQLTEKLPFYAMRHLVRPGLTGGRGEVRLRR